jgi:hypothetical protein
MSFVDFLTPPLYDYYKLRIAKDSLIEATGFYEVKFTLSALSTNGFVRSTAESFFLTVVPAELEATSEDE